MSVTLTLSNTTLEARTVAGEERLGVASRFEVTAAAAAPLDGKSLLRAPCALTFQSRHGDRTVMGVVLRVTTVATARPGEERTVRLTVASRIALLELGRRSRVYQRMSVPDIAKKLLEDGGYAPGDVRFELAETHAPRRYVVQYDESDATFVRRLCEDEGLYFRFEAEDGREIIVLADRSPSAPAALDAPLYLAGDPHLNAPEPAAYGWISSRRRAPGKVRLRDHDPERPLAPLEGSAEDGNDIERKTAVYAAPGGFRDEAGGRRRAATRLEALRGAAETSTFQSNALALCPGLSFSVDADSSVVAPRDKEHVVLAVRHKWSAAGDHHSMEVEAVPRRVNYRLPMITPRPHIAGLQSAIVTGAKGEEIHTDELGRVFVRFLWDRGGPTDETSSLPVRVLQPAVAGSMLLPRVGWEVLVAFEDGDPERPFIVGRSYNAKMPPPFPLPENKMLTSLATDSSPGGAGRNSIHFDDGAGRQHLKIQATFGKTTSVGGSMRTQTAKNERHSVSGSQSHTIGGDEVIKVAESLFETLGSRLVNISGADDIGVVGDYAVSTGTAVTAVGGALIETVGNPAKGVANLGVNAILHGIGGIGPKGAIVAAAAGIAKGAIEAGREKHSFSEGAKAAGLGAVGVLADKVPGGEALLSAITGATQPNPWDHAKESGGDRADGGGAGGGASDASAAKGPGPGHRNVIVNGVAIEVNGGMLEIATPGRVGWTTAGAGVFLTGGSRSVSAADVTHRTLGASVEAVASSFVNAAGNISKSSNAATSLTVAGALSEAAGSNYVLRAPTISIHVGALTLSAGTVLFETPDAKLEISGAGVVLEAKSVVNFSGSFRQSGTMGVT